MALKRLQYADIPKENKDDAKSLVKWFHDFRDFTIVGSWYPDEVFKDMTPSHIIKYVPAGEGEVKFKSLPKTMEMFGEGKKSPLYGKPFTITMGNCADRCESISHSIVDNFKILQSEDRGCPISTSSNHIAMRFFILSHYIADCHMPLHCDNRQFSGGQDLHGYIEGIWDKEIRKSYQIDIANNRFFYAPDGYPLEAKITPLVKAVEEDIVKREFLYAWGPGNKSTWDYMSAVSQYSYLMAYKMLPKSMNEKTTTAQYKASEAFGNLEEYSRMVFCDAIDSIARVRVHAWDSDRDWDKGKSKKN